MQDAGLRIKEQREQESAHALGILVFSRRGPEQRLDFRTALLDIGIQGKQSG